MTKDYLKEKGLKFKEIDVSVDHAAATEMIEKSGQMGVPVIDIDGELVIGFDKPKIEEVLKMKNNK
jgi:glutaredoxin